jgi:uncharacterized protein YqjF (DUF2071 family)
MVLKANWKKLVMANYQVDPDVLRPFIPFGTELDYYSDACYVSLVGFMFLDSTFGGIPLPFHQSFEEVNLRFYVRSDQNGSSERGVVFIKEIVPQAAVTLVANSFYKEHYETCPMEHHWQFSSDTQQIEYRWKKEKWYSLKIVSAIIAQELTAGSEADFFTEHYLGCTKIHDRLTLEYTVAHDPWMVYDTKNYIIDVDFEAVYGKTFAFLNHVKPASVFLAEGSGISLQKSRKIRG